MIDIQTSIPFVTDIDHEILPVVSESFSNSGPLHFELCKGLDFTSKNQLPIVNRADFAIPERMSTYHRIKNVNRKNLSGSCVHFFVDDSHIEPLWKHPRLYAKILLRFDTVLSPDFSVFMNMLRIQKWWNDYRNKFLAAHLQRYGVNIIPAPSWADIEDIERYAEGWPKHSLIAINI